MDTHEIDKAITDHLLWKSMLRSAIDTGEVVIPVAQIRADTECAFGKWFFGPNLSDQDKQSEHYRAVKEIHNDFHKLAGDIAELATTGRKAEAERKIARGGNFTKISIDLITALMVWRESEL